MGGTLRPYKYPVLFQNFPLVFGNPALPATFCVPEVPINKFMAGHAAVSFNAQKENKLESLRSSSALKFSSSEN